ncbi:MAG: NAD(+)/NADH kinase [Acidimicrobiales bacterium]
MSRFVLVVNGGRDRAVELAREAAGWLTERGHDVRLSKEDAAATGLDALGVDPAALGDEIDLALALGGDGTILRAVHLAAAHAIPVLGVNLGRLAYLSSVEPDDLCRALQWFLDGEYAVEERTMISVTTGAGDTHLALNEAVVEKSSPGHTVHLAVSVDGRFFTSHVADALILGTPTGSTAYSFSAGGPIVSPSHDALIVTPVAPHTPFTRSLVLHAGEPVRAEVLDDRGAVLSMDGLEVARLAKGETVTGQVAGTRARFVTFGERDFYGVLKAKFGLSDR